MESLPGYDEWLQSGYDEGEACQHECSECDGLGELDGVKCDYCGGEGVCDGGCEPDEPDYSWEPEPDYE